MRAVRRLLKKDKIGRLNLRYKIYKHMYRFIKVSHEMYLINKQNISSSHFRLNLVRRQPISFAFTCHFAKQKKNRYISIL